MMKPNLEANSSIWINSSLWPRSGLETRMAFVFSGLMFHRKHLFQPWLLSSFFLYLLPFQHLPFRHPSLSTSSNYSLDCPTLKMRKLRPGYVSYITRLFSWPGPGLLISSPCFSHYTCSPVSNKYYWTMTEWSVCAKHLAGCIQMNKIGGPPRLEGD